MGYDKKLEKRVSDILTETRGIEIKKMFGGICYMHRGNMLCGIDKKRLMVRVGPKQYEDVLNMKSAKVMDITGKPMKGFIFVDSEGIKSKKDLSSWIQLGLNFTSTLKPK